MCHAHHILHWLHGGHTKLANLVLLCGHHHRVIHHTPWEVRLNPRRRATRVPPTAETRDHPDLDPAPPPDASNPGRASADDRDQP